MVIFVRFFVARDSVPHAGSSKGCLKLDLSLQHTKIPCEIVK
jgi:hypothetical protein